MIKLLMTLVLLAPVSLFCQNIVCVDTVTISGFFYKIKNNRLAPESFTHDDQHFYFLPEDETKRKNIFLMIGERGEVHEQDTVKFLSYKITNNLRAYTDSPCIQQLSNTIDIQPFSNQKKLLKVKGYRHKKVALTYVNVRWLHHKIRKSVACNEGFDQPPSLFCNLKEDKLFDIYLPLAVLEIRNNIQLKDLKRREIKTK